MDAGTFLFFIIALPPVVIMIAVVAHHSFMRGNRLVAEAWQRAAAEFEKLRMAASELEEKGKAPVIHQLNMGPSGRYRIRADWTSAFFQAGGFKLLNEDDYQSNADAVEALSKSGAKIAIITSDDERYANTVEDLTKSIKNNCGEVAVYVAGAPGDNETAWKAAGVDGFVNIRVNNYELNRQLLESLGASL